MARAGATPTPPTTNRTLRPSASAGVQVPYGPSTATLRPGREPAEVVAGVAPLLDREAQLGRWSARPRASTGGRATRGRAAARGAGRTARAERRRGARRAARCTADVPAPAGTTARTRQGRAAARSVVPHRPHTSAATTATCRPTQNHRARRSSARSPPRSELVGEGQGQAGVGQQVHEVPGLVGQLPPERAQRGHRHDADEQRPDRRRRPCRARGRSGPGRRPTRRPGRRTAATTPATTWAPTRIAVVSPA